MSSNRTALNAYLNGSVKQDELYREAKDLHKNDKQAYYDAVNAIRVSKTSHATEFEDFR